MVKLCPTLSNNSSFAYHEMRKFLNLMEKLWQKKKFFLKNAKLYIWDGTSSSKMSTSWPRIIPALVVIQGTIKLEICIKSKLG